MTSPFLPETSRHDVTIVLVTHDGRRWLPRVLPAILGQTRAGDRLVVADTGSTDGTAALLEQFVPASDLVDLPRRTGYGAAVKAALAHADSVPAAGPSDGASDDAASSWVWLLHDDSEPAADALEQLLAAVEADPGVAVAGTKVRGWYRRRMLLEVGVSVDGGGRRETALERGEQDQGQHDNRRETLAVSSAGMLVRRDVWDALGGFDRHLPLMRDDLDLCWRAWLAGHRVAVVPAAVIYHAEASAQARREVHAGSGRVHHLDRAGALRVLLANLSTTAFLLAWPRLAIGGLLRAAGYLVAKIPRHAADELLALGSVVLRPRAIWRMRKERRTGHQVSPRSLRRLFPRPGHQLAQARDALAGVAGGRRVEGVAIGSHRAAESGPGSEEAENLDVGTGGVLIRRALRKPGWLLVIALVALTLLSARDLLAGGRLLGGALLPAPGGASDLWTAYTDSWHPDSTGGAGAAPPYLAVVGALGTLLLGHADLAVTALLVGSVPLAGLTAYLAAGALPTSRGLRIWAGAAYALVPVFSAAVAAGRLGSAFAAAVLPALVLAVVRAVGVPGRAGTTRAAWTAALTLSVMTAFVPLAWLLALLAVGAVAAGARALLGGWDRDLMLRLAVIVIVPPVALMPWSAQLVLHPGRLLGEPGAPGPDLAVPAQDTWRILLFDAGGPGPAPGWVGVAVIVAGLVGLATAARRLIPMIAVGVAGLGYSVALLASRIEIRAPAGGTQVPAWPGLALALAALGLLVAAVVGVHGAAGRLGAREFGLAQPAAALIAVVAIAGPAVAGAAWLARGAGDPLKRDSAVLVPAFVAAEAETSDRPRTLALRARKTSGSLSYSLVRDSGPRLGAGEVAPSERAIGRLGPLVADLVSGRGDQVVSRLANFAVRYVLVKAPVSTDLSRALDAVPGLERISAQGGDGLWRAQIPVARLSFVPAGAGAATPVPSGRVGAEADLPPTSGGGMLALAEPVSAHWKAELNGRALEPQLHDGWAQAFAVPAGGGHLTLRWSDPVRSIWLFSQASFLIVMIVLALPGGGGRRPRDDEEVPLAAAPARRHARSEGDGAADGVAEGASEEPGAGS